MEYIGCESCRYFATEFCQYGREDPRANQAHDNVGYVRDDGSTGPGVIDLDQEAVDFKASQHMPANCDTPSDKHTSKPN